MKPKIILTFDLEEFDLPLEYNCPIQEEMQFKITKEGLLRLVDMLKQHKINATFFTTGSFCEKNQDCIKSLSKNHEIGSHAYYHSQFKEEYINKSKRILESTSGKQVKGFRMPFFRKIDYNKLKEAGYEYDSSVNPSIIPGRYNNFRVSRTPFVNADSGIIEFPVSVSPVIRFPLFWLSFKNLPFSLYYLLCNSALKKDKFLHLYFHPWEFAKINQFQIPGYVKNLNDEGYSNKFDKLLKLLKTKGEFVTSSEFLGSYKF